MMVYRVVLVLELPDDPGADHFHILQFPTTAALEPFIADKADEIHPLYLRHEVCIKQDFLRDIACQMLMAPPPCRSLPAKAHHQACRLPTPTWV
jgi:hypothetical protein